MRNNAGAFALTRFSSKPGVVILTPLLALGILIAPLALADIGSRLWTTGGVTTIEGSADGGLVPWALLGSYASDEEWGGTVAISRAEVDDYTLAVVGAGLNWNNHVEVTLARQTLDLSSLNQDIFGLKVRLMGENDVPTAAQNRLIKKLLPMYPDIRHL